MRPSDCRRLREYDECRAVGALAEPVCGRADITGPAVINIPKGCGTASGHTGQGGRSGSLVSVRLAVASQFQPLILDHWSLGPCPQTCECRRCLAVPVHSDPSSSPTSLPTTSPSPAPLYCEVARLEHTGGSGL